MHHVLKYHQMYQTEGILGMTHLSILESKHAKILNYPTSMMLGMSRFTAFPPLEMVFENIFAGD